jgi:hypothetical protein
MKFESLLAIIRQRNWLRQIYAVHESETRLNDFLPVERSQAGMMISIHVLDTIEKR